jgi:mono/diheme cytochrome c family protein
MLRNFALTVFAGLAAVTMGVAQQSTVTLPVGKTAPNDGKQMFVNYCAPCHGADGKGNGPQVSALVQRPVDLTVLAKNNGGKFPASHVTAVLNFGAKDAAAHGTRDMPVWGPILGSMGQPEDNRTTQALRVKNLEAYIESIQVK